MATVYYTLSAQGRAWFNNRAEAPRAGVKVLRALAEEITENDVPRTAEQIARAAGAPVDATQKAISYLVKQGYIVIGRLPRPSEPTETPKPRIRSVEDIVKSEIRAQEARKRYEQSEKGVLAHIKYELSASGRAKNKKYWSSRGKLIQKAFRLRRNIRSMESLGVNKQLLDQERAKLAEVEAQLKKEE